MTQATRKIIGNAETRARAAIRNEPSQSLDAGCAASAAAAATAAIAAAAVSPSQKA
jgi:hypothetical protein